MKSGNQKFIFKNYILIVIAIIFFQKSSSAQSQITTSADFLTGKVVDNYPSFPEVPNNAYLIELRVNKHLTGTKNWHRYYHYPNLGINLVHGSLGNNQVFGKVTALMAEMNFNQKLNSKFSFEEGLNLGVAHFSKKYDEVNNPTNIVIGSYYTAFASASLKFNYHFTNHISANATVAVLHGSNSHLALPNVGINLRTYGAGIKYSFSNSNSITNHFKDTIFDKHIHFNIRVALGFNEQGTSTSAVNGPKYPIYLGSFFITKKFSLINKVQFGVEAYYNAGVHDFITSHNTYNSQQKWKSSAVVIILGDEFLMGHVSLLTQIGCYVYNPFYKDQYEIFYNGDFKAKLKTIITAKLGVQYYLKNITMKDKNQIYVGCYVKTNFGQADFFETGLGYQF